MGFRDLFFYHQECIFIVDETEILNRPKQLSVMPKLSQPVNIERNIERWTVLVNIQSAF